MAIGMRDARNDRIDRAQTVLRMLARARRSPKAVARIRDGVVTTAEAMKRRDRSRSRRGAAASSEPPVVAS